MTYSSKQQYPKIKNKDSTVCPALFTMVWMNSPRLACDAFLVIGLTRGLFCLVPVITEQALSSWKNWVGSALNFQPGHYFYSFHFTCLTY